MPPKTPFPSQKDVTNLSRYDATRALAVLWRLQKSELAKVYTAHRTDPRQPLVWNVWLELTRRRVELAAWCAEWLASQENPDDDGSGDAA